MGRIRGFQWAFFWLASAACCAGLLGFSAVSNLGMLGPTRVTTTLSKVLTGSIIALDAGHGGYDGGAVGRQTGVQEKELNLDVTLRLRTALEAHGAQVILTRDDDYALCDENPPIRKKLQDMQRRAALVESGQAELLLSIHMNEYSNRRQAGPQVFFRKGCPAGQLLAGLMQQRMNEQLKPARQRVINTGDYYILTLGIPSVLVECGFLSNAAEEAQLRDPAYRQRVAESICDGVLDWYAQAERPAPLSRQKR